MSLADFVYPKKCLGCKKSGSYLCKKCLSEAKFAGQICIKCRRAAIDGVTHSRCATPWGLDGNISIWVYRGVIRKAILSVKYKFLHDIGMEHKGLEFSEILSHESANWIS